MRMIMYRQINKENDEIIFVCQEKVNPSTRVPHVGEIVRFAKYPDSISTCIFRVTGVSHIKDIISDEPISGSTVRRRMCDHGEVVVNLEIVREM